MRFLWVLIFVTCFVSFASGQDKEPKQIPIVDPVSYVYTNSNDLKTKLTYTIPQLKSNPNLNIYIIYYASSKKNSIKFDEFRQKALKILVKFNKIEAERVFIVDGGNLGFSAVEFRIFIVDKNKIPLSP